ncbi:MAG: hypothetical protein Tsb002_30340 [Wenzhouxiangellaceae bacterium]
MFERKQTEMENLLKESDDFRRLYDQHQQLDQQVTEAENGDMPMEELELHQLKKRKLWAKDQLARMMEDYLSPTH